MNGRVNLRAPGNFVDWRDEKTLLYRGFRYPTEINSHVVLLYFQLGLIFREIEQLMPMDVEVRQGICQ